MVAGSGAGKDRTGLEVVLVRVTASGEQLSVPLTREQTLIGRLDDSHIRIPAAGISRKHCEIVVRDGSISISDLGSSNGTYVNQDRVDSSPLSAGDLISVGGLVFVVQVNGEPGDINPAMMYEDGVPDDAAASAAPGAPASSASEPTASAPKKVPANQASDDLGMDDSSMTDFEFDFDDDDDQPPL